MNSFYGNLFLGQGINLGSWISRLSPSNKNHQKVLPNLGADIQSKYYKSPLMIKSGNTEKHRLLALGGGL